MKIVIDGRMISWTGIGRYTRALLDNLQELDKDNSYVVILLQNDFDSWSPSADNFSKAIVDIEPYTVTEQVLLPFKLMSLKPDLVHFCHFSLPILYPGRYAATIHDLTLMEFKNYRGSGLAKLKYEVRYWAMRLLMQVCTWRAKQIIVPSKATAERLARHFPTSKSKINVTYEAVDKLGAGQPEPVDEVRRPFLMYLGNYYPYKNVPNLIRAAAKVRQKHADLQLVLPGGNWRNIHFVEEVQKAVSEFMNEGWLIFPGFVKDEQLAWLYQNTELFIFPSLSEGFGIPGLEAMANGAPVAASTATCLPEIYGDAAHYFDPADPDDMAKAISDVLDNSEMRIHLVEAGRERLKLYSWRRMAEETLAVYQKALR